MKKLHDIKPYLIDRTIKVLEKAHKYSNDTRDDINKSITAYCKSNTLDVSQCCIIVVGSLGREEALEASDIDLIPIINKKYLEKFKQHDKKIRETICKDLNIHVSSGHNLTECTDLDSLVAADSIGGGIDTSSQLTKRILILTEGQQVGGTLEIEVIKQAILDAYEKNATTSGRHVLTLCNDLARYYRTLCIEYKAKIDVANKDWCTRNAKLRHSRKVWYFSSLISIVSVATNHHANKQIFQKELLDLFNTPPLLRLFNSIQPSHYYSVGKLLEYYTWFLNFMSDDKNRKSLEAIKYEERYNPENYLYYSVKLNSDMIHNFISKIIDDLEPNAKQKVIDWFLL